MMQGGGKTTKTLNRATFRDCRVLVSPAASRTRRTPQNTGRFLLGLPANHFPTREGKRVFKWRPTQNKRNHSFPVAKALGT